MEKGIQICRVCGSETPYGKIYRDGYAGEPYFFCNRCVLSKRDTSKKNMRVSILNTVTMTILLGGFFTLISYASSWNLWVLLSGILLVTPIDALFITRYRRSKSVLKALETNDHVQIERLINEKWAAKLGVGMASNKALEKSYDRLQLIRRTQTSQQFIDEMASKCDFVRLQGVGPIIASPWGTCHFSYVSYMDTVPEYLEYEGDMRPRILHPNIVLESGWHIYHSGIEFPDHCVACMKPKKEYILIEKYFPVGYIEKWRIIDIDSYEPSKKDRIQQALGARCWFAVPFCEEHRFHSNAVKIEMFGSGPLSWRIKVSFSNIEYGKLFGAANPRLQERHVTISKGE